jgi:hypothetical protein
MPVMAVRTQVDGDSGDEGGPLESPVFAGELAAEGSGAFRVREGFFAFAGAPALVRFPPPDAAFGRHAILLLLAPSVRAIAVLAAWVIQFPGADQRSIEAWSYLAADDSVLGSFAKTAPLGDRDVVSALLPVLVEASAAQQELAL